MVAHSNRNSSSRASSGPWVHQICVVHSHTCRHNIHIHKIKDEKEVSKGLVVPWDLDLDFIPLLIQRNKVAKTTWGDKTREVWTVNERCEQWMRGVDSECEVWTVNERYEQWIRGVNSEWKAWTVIRDMTSEWEVWTVNGENRPLSMHHDSQWKFLRVDGWEDKCACVHAYMCWANVCILMYISMYVHIGVNIQL